MSRKQRYFEGWNEIMMYTIVSLVLEIEALAER